MVFSLWKEPAEFEVSDLTVHPKMIKSGQEVTVSAIVRNIGGEPGTKTVKFTIDGETKTKDITLKSKESENVTISLIKRRTGTYNVNFSGMSDNFTVYCPLEAITVTDLSISPSKVQPGQPVTISVKAVNTGGCKRSRKIELLIGETVEKTENVTLEPKENTTIHFTLRKTTCKKYTVSIGCLKKDKQTDHTFEVLLNPKPSKCQIEMEVDGKVLHYRKIQTWSEGPFYNVLENRTEFKSSLRNQFKETYDVQASNFGMKFLEDNHSTVFKCDILGKISESEEEYTATFLWFLNPQGLDFIEDSFDESKDSLTWIGEIDDIRTNIIIRLPKQDSNYREWGDPVGHCHGHVWWPKTQVSEENKVTVTRIVDGDTIEVKFPSGEENKVRMVGIDTPETFNETKPEEWEGIDNSQYIQEWGYKAKDYTSSNLLNREIRLQFDETAGRIGYYGRLLAYIIIDNTNFNLELVEKGYARAYTGDDCELYENFVKTEITTRKERKGIWNILENGTETQNIYISGFHPDAQGTPEREHLDDEYIIIKNGQSSPVDMSGWTLSDEADHVFTFPQGFKLNKNSEVTVYTGHGTNTDTELYWNSDTPIWNNSGDNAYLRTPDGSLIDRERW